MKSKKSELFANCSSSELVSVNGLAWLFGAAVAIGSIVVSVLMYFLFYLLNIDQHAGGIYVNMAIAIGVNFMSAQFVLSRFGKKHGRILAIEEYKRITRLGSVAATIFLAPLLVLGVFAIMVSISPNIPIWLTISILLLALILQGLLQWLFSCFAFLKVIKISKQTKDKKLLKMG